jgi:hypothetical protein
MHGRYAMWSSCVDVGCCDRKGCAVRAQVALGKLLVLPHIIGELLHRQRTIDLTPWDRVAFDGKLVLIGLCL